MWRRKEGKKWKEGTDRDREKEGFTSNTRRFSDRLPFAMGSNLCYNGSQMLPLSSPQRKERKLLKETHERKGRKR